ncbi:MAG: DUF4384 domain-containing protein [Bacteroidales bacterium]|jgi:hypothetical protein|nr:DUF4384 domain-containing protein [Bacteroidales bacterium]
MNAGCVRTTLAVILFFGWLLVGAQDIKIDRATGEWSISNISPEQAYERALTEAKFEALRLAGIDESINEINSLYTTQQGQSYTGVSNIELGGEVVDFTILEKKIEQKQAGTDLLVARVAIKAVVRKYDKKRDPSFLLKVEGIEHAYRNGDKLSFFVTPYGDGFLKIFVFEHNNNGYLLYPNEYEKNRLFQSNTKVKFPLSYGFDYQLEKIDATKISETNLLLFVYTKQDVPFFEKEINFHSVLNWIAKISPDNRVEVRSLYQITQRNSKN